ncbi:MAG: energy transducer TonB [Acidimicrobiia bacterium]|nr:energy transducer TonB [Acidimicrobiia bacterium]
MQRLRPSNDGHNKCRDQIGDGQQASDVEQPRVNAEHTDAGVRVQDNHRRVAEREQNPQFGRVELAALQARLAVLEAERAASNLANVPLPTWTAGDPPLRIGGHIKEPRKIKDVRPVYPDIALSARVQGIVIIEAQIDQDGKVNNARVIRPVALLDQAALDAVLQWEFEPVLLNGQPVPVIMTVTVNFTLPGL